MGLADTLAATTGTYFGSGDGIESGPFVARIVISSVPNGGVAIEYEATSREQGVQHREHSLLSGGPDGRDRLYVAHSESPFVTELVASDVGAGRFEQPVAAGPYALTVVIEVPEPDRLTYAWWWAAAGEEPVEQSKADVRRRP
ncbi:MAG: hypothetical protein AAFZ07_03765 [Actinomycetota bacterium]